MKLIWPKKPVSSELMRLTIQNHVVNNRGFIYHNCYGAWFKFKGKNIIYKPFGNGTVVVIHNVYGGASVENDFFVCTSFCALIGLVRSLRQGGDV